MLLVEAWGVLAGVGGGMGLLTNKIWVKQWARMNCHGPGNSEQIQA